MTALKVFSVFILFAVISAQDVEFRRSSGIVSGARVDGDEFLFISHRMSPFFQERSNFETVLEYNGGDKIANITRFEIITYGVVNYSDSVVSGGIGANSIKATLKMENILFTESIMKVYGFANPKE